MLFRSKAIMVWRSKAILKRPLDRYLTDIAAQTIALATREGATSVHLLRAMAAADKGVAVRALSALGVTLQDLEVPESPPGPSLDTILGLARQEAFALGHRYIGTEHLLLALLREGSGAAAQALIARGATLEATRHMVVRVLHGEE